MVRLYSLDEASFDTLTPEALYWIGFLLADGCVSDAGYLTLALAKKDEGHVALFRAFLKAEIPVKHVLASKKYPTAHFRVGSKLLVNSLRKVGITPRKSKTAYAVPSVAASRDFWRGVFDGDGYVGTDTCKRLRLELTCNSQLGEQFLEFLRVEGVQTKATVRPHKGHFRVVLLSTPAKATHAVLYAGSTLHLDRKAQYGLGC